MDTLNCILCGKVIGDATASATVKGRAGEHGFSADDASTCNSCSAKIKKEKSEKRYNRDNKPDWFVNILSLMFFPIGFIYYFWNRKEYPKKSNYALVFALIPSVLFPGAFVFAEYATDYTKYIELLLIPGGFIIFFVLRYKKPKIAIVALILSSILFLPSFYSALHFPLISRSSLLFLIGIILYSAWKNKKPKLAIGVLIATFIPLLFFFTAYLILTRL